MNTKLPMILLCTMEDELLANEFCSKLIMIKPGNKKAVYFNWS